MSWQPIEQWPGSGKGLAALGLALNLLSVVGLIVLVFLMILAGP